MSAHRNRRVKTSTGGRYTLMVSRHEAHGPAKENPVYTFRGFEISRNRTGQTWGWKATSTTIPSGPYFGVTLGIVVEAITSASMKPLTPPEKTVVTVTPAPGSSPEVVDRLKRAFAPPAPKHTVSPAAQKTLEKVAADLPSAKCHCPEDLPLHLSDCPEFHGAPRPKHGFNDPPVPVEKGEAWAKRAMKRIVERLGVHPTTTHDSPVRVALNAASSKVEHATVESGLCPSCGEKVHACTTERALRAKIQHTEEILKTLVEFWSNGTPVHPGSEIAIEATKFLEEGK